MPWEVFATADLLARAAAEAFVGCAAESTRASGRFAVALSGGSTPAGVYALLATDAYARRVDWSRVHVFWGDEASGSGGRWHSTSPRWCRGRDPVPRRGRGEGRDLVPGARRTVRADRLPAQAIAPRSGHLRWLVDAAAAARLRGR